MSISFLKIRTFLYGSSCTRSLRCSERSHSKKPVSPESRQTLLKRSTLLFEKCHLNYLCHSSTYLLLQAGENIRVVDLETETNQVTTWSPKVANDSLQFESEEQKTAILRRGEVKAAHLTPSNQIVVITESAVVSIWDPKPLKCIKAFTVFLCPTEQVVINGYWPQVLCSQFPCRS